MRILNLNVEKEVRAKSNKILLFPAGNDMDSMNSEDQTVRTANAANEDNNNGHTALHQNQSDEDTNDRTSGTTITTTSGAVEDNVIFQSKSKQQVVLETETAAIIQEQTASSMS